MPTSPATILLCTANAVHPRRMLQIEDELRAIDEALQRSRMREGYVIRPSPAVSFTKVAHEIDDHQPTIIHFSGHGHPTGRLILKDDQGGEQPIPPERIADLLGTMPTPPALVVFATCYSAELARAAIEHADYAIGFDGPFDNESAAAFSAALYERLAARPEIDVPRAFALAMTICEGLPTMELARLHAGASTPAHRVSRPTPRTHSEAKGDDLSDAMHERSKSTGVDVLVITALPEELSTLLEVTEGVTEPWTKAEDDELPHHLTTLAGKAGPLRIAAARLTRMGGVATTAMATRLIERLDPGGLAMCGVCAGRPGDTELGDVVIADRVFAHDEGKLGRHGFAGDLWVHAPGDRWLRASQDLEGPAVDLHGYVEASADLGRVWFLEQLLADRNPLECDSLRRYIPDARRAQMLESMVARGDVELIDAVFTLTPTGRSAIKNHRALHGTLATRLPYHVHVGPIGSGSAVMSDGTIWERIAGGGQRKILAVEMEAASIGQIAHLHGLPFAVVKGVMDHADAHKSDRFKGFAARAAAEVLCGFLRRVAVPADRSGGHPPRQTPPDPRARPSDTRTSSPEPRPTTAELVDELRELVDELARVIHDRGQARVLVMGCGLPPQFIPEAGTSREFWYTVATEAHNGRIPGGLRALGKAAAKDYPGNRIFARYRE